jgi:hypothetical protein
MRLTLITLLVGLGIIVAGAIQTEAHHQMLTANVPSHPLALR